jgi:uncharacterized CHY-type Zn-finger protein
MSDIEQDADRCLLFLLGRKWFDCADCHEESESHPLLKRFEVTFACKKCKKAFRKDTQEFDESDEYCPHCDNHFVINALTPKPRVEIEGEDARVDARWAMGDQWRANANTC